MRDTGAAILEVKLVYQLTYLEQETFFAFFLDLKKASASMDWECVLELLESYGIGPNMLRLVRTFWGLTVLVCQAQGNCSRPFGPDRGVTQSGPLSLFILN